MRGCSAYFRVCVCVCVWEGVLSTNSWHSDDSVREGDVATMPELCCSVCCSELQWVAVSCVAVCVAVSCSELQWVAWVVLQCVAICCSVLQRGAAWCSGGAMSLWWATFEGDAASVPELCCSVCCSELQWVAVYCNVLQWWLNECVMRSLWARRYRNDIWVVLQCVAACCSDKLMGVISHRGHLHSYAQICSYTYVYTYTYTYTCTYTYFCKYKFVQAYSCNTLQRTPHMRTFRVSHCNTLQHTATHCNSLQHTATHCNTLQHTETHSNTPQHTATHWNLQQHPALPSNTNLHIWGGYD